MARRRNTLKATSEELECIKAAAKKRGWTTTPDSRAPIETSQRLIEKKLQSCPARDENYCIPLEVLENWIDEEEINVKDKKIYRKFTDKIENINNAKVSSLDLDKLVLDGVILASGVSLPTYCKFVRGENRINSNAFIAFWEALGFDRRDISELQTQFKRQGGRKPDRLYKALLSFDYRDPCQHVLNICNPSCHSAAFFIPHTQVLGCQFSQVWLMRRLEQELAEYINLETRKERFNLKSEAATVENLWMKLGGRLQICDSSEISERLKKHHLILVLDRIDTFDRTRLNELMAKFWKPLSQQASRSHGRLILFLVDGGLPNDWRDESTLYDGVIKVSAIPSYSSNDIHQDLRKLEARVQEPINGKIENFVRELMEHQKPERCNLILQKIYQQFNCRFSAEQRWQQYP